MILFLLLSLTGPEGHCQFLRRSRFLSSADYDEAMKGGKKHFYAVSSYIN